MTAVMQNIATVYDSLGLCKFMLVAGIGPTTLARWVEAATGWEINRDELMAAGARAVTAKTLYNLDRLGLPPGPDLARRLRLEPRGTGGSAHALPDLETMVRDYYRARGWSEDGRPPEDQRPG
jgi:aldehyde:ferredoxin oxidoreductase